MNDLERDLARRVARRARGRPGPCRPRRGGRAPRTARCECPGRGSRARSRHRSVSVVLLPADVRNTSTAGPMQISSPSASSAAAVTRWPRRNVPFLLPRSSSTTLAASTTIRAWWRDTRARSMTMRASEARPSRFSPSPSGMWRSAQTARRHGAGAAAGRCFGYRVPGKGVAEAMDGAQQVGRCASSPSAARTSATRLARLDPRRSCPARAAGGSPAW